MSRAIPQLSRRPRKAVYVDETPVGRGVFAGRLFRRDAVIGRIRGEIIDDEDYGSEYCMSLDDMGSLEPEAPFRFLNHSCEANAALEYDVVARGAGREIRMYVVAQRDLAAGEEITIDYNWPADAAIPCCCGTPSCRGWIVDPDELAIVKRRARAAARKAARQPQQSA